MLRFRVFEDGQVADDWPLRNAHLIGSDSSAMRGDITFRDGEIQVQKRELGSTALALQQPMDSIGEMTVQTTLLPDRDDPYLLSLEQARHRLMMLWAKLEDWGLLDLAKDHPIARAVVKCRELFIEALCFQKSDPAKADRMAKKCLAASVDTSEELALMHAESLLNRRKAAGVLPRYALGCTATLEQKTDAIRATILSNFDFLYLPTPWKSLAVAEGEYRWEVMDDWVQWATKHRLPVVGGPLVSFHHQVLPEWVYIWEHDYDAIRDLIYEHVERVATRYRNSIRAWNAVSGLHVNNQFNFTFDQLMDLSRMTTMLIKKVQPAAKCLVEVRQPFGEYYGNNQRSIPPLMYADLLVQGGIQFDAFVLKVTMGQAQPGQYARDLMQLSNLMDQFSVFGKPVHIVIGAPSAAVEEWMIATPDAADVVDPNSGVWRKTWSPAVQGKWLGAVLRIAMSKPFVETVSWNELVDHGNAELPVGGIIDEELKPKKAFKALVEFRKMLADENAVFNDFGGADHEA